MLLGTEIKPAVNPGREPSLCAQRAILLPSGPSPSSRQCHLLGHFTCDLWFSALICTVDVLEGAPVLGSGSGLGLTVLAGSMWGVAEGQHGIGMHLQNPCACSANHHRAAEKGSCPHLRSLERSWAQCCSPPGVCFCRICLLPFISQEGLRASQAPDESQGPSPPSNPYPKPNLSLPITPKSPYHPISFSIPQPPTPVVLCHFGFPQSGTGGHFSALQAPRLLHEKVGEPGWDFRRCLVSRDTS